MVLAEFEVHIVQFQNMTRFFTTRFSLLRVAMFAASVLVALLNSSVSHASCGDYVYSRFRTPTNHGNMVIRRVEANTLNIAKSQIVRAKIGGLRGDVAETMPQPEAPAPCHGPNCSQNPTPFVPVAPSITVGSSSQDLSLIHISEPTRPY